MNSLQAGLECGHPAALDDLGIEHDGTVPGVGAVHVPLDVRIPDDGDAPVEGHREDFKVQFFLK